MTDRSAADNTIAAFMHERMWWDETIRAIGVGRLDEPGMMGEWSPKDLIAHLSGWQWKTIQSLKSSLAGSGYPATPWPNELNNPDSWEDDGDFEAINQWIHKEVAAQTPEAVIATSRAQWDELHNVVTGLSPEQLNDPKLFVRTGGQSLGAQIESGEFFGHFREHRADDIDPWLNKNGRMF